MSKKDDSGLTEDEKQALRILSLVVNFTNQNKPIESTDLWRIFYPDLSQSSFQKAFRRDRDRMALCGVLVSQAEGKSGDVAWQLDTTASLAGQARLNAKEALELIVTTAPLASDPSFAYGDELRMALAKVAGSFSDLSSHSLGAVANQPSALKSLRACLSERTPFRAEYEDAQGASREHTLAPLGFFGLREQIYMVAANVSEQLEHAKSSSKSEPGGANSPLLLDLATSPAFKTYRVDRMRDVRPIKQAVYSIPIDFDIDNYIRLPFQIGPESFTATFFVPDKHLVDVRSRARGQGVWEQQDIGALWKVAANSTSVAASWAVAEGIEPRRPKALVEAWKLLLGEVVQHASS